jgi:phage N-6-adenine-methyltransferase
VNSKQLGINNPQYKPKDDYYTPKWVFDALGLTFDLDPAHPDHATNVPCKKYYTKEQDGLNKEWEGLIWVNPPFSNMRPFVEKFIKHNQGVILVPFSKSKAIEFLWNQSDGILVPFAASFKFDTESGKPAGIFMPVLMFSMGNVATEALIKSGLGRVR